MAKMGRPRRDYKGQTFGTRTVVKNVGEERREVWLVQCTCGVTREFAHAAMHDIARTRHRCQACVPRQDMGETYEAVKDRLGVVPNVQLAKELGVSRERVRQFCIKKGVDSAPRVPRQGLKEKE